MVSLASFVEEGRLAGKSREEDWEEEGEGSKNKRKTGEEKRMTEAKTRDGQNGESI